VVAWGQEFKRRDSGLTARHSLILIELTGDELTGDELTGDELTKKGHSLGVPQVLAALRSSL
jgi:hypothetical protein